MNIKTIKAGAYATNCYIVSEDQGTQGVIIDPAGAYNEIKDYINENNLEIPYILLTHGHGDHIGAVLQIKENYGAKVLVHEKDAYMIENASKNLTDQLGSGPVEFMADDYVTHGQVIEVGNLKIKVLHTPGHTQGSVCYKIKNHVFSGDTLFASSIGRTDLEGGDRDQILSSIKEKLLILPNETLIYPGHGAQTSLKKEKVNNPFI
jgi:glyoxylase-like metal-dependent hydrolase (beta-lactamase superfamily II)